MAIGTREQSEKWMDRKPRSRKILKKWQHRKARHIAKLNPECPPLPKYKGWEW